MFIPNALKAVFLFCVLALGASFVVPAHAYTAGTWDNACTLSNKASDPSRFFPPQGDVAAFLKKRGVKTVKDIVPNIECNMASASFPGKTDVAWPLKTRCGCFYVNQRDVNSDKVYYIPLDQERECLAFYNAAKGYLSSELEIVDCGGNPDPPPPPYCIPATVTTCSTNDIAMVFVFDVSGSIQAAKTFPYQMEFVEKIVNFLSPLGSKNADKGGGQNGVPLSHVNEYGWASFAEVVRDYQGDGAYVADGSSPQKMVKEIYGITGGATAVGAGLLRGYYLIKPMKASKKVIVLISDGYNNQQPDPVKIARDIRDQGIIIISVGVGGINYGKFDVNEKFMIEMSGSKDRYVAVSFEDLPSLAGNLIRTVCEDKPICIWP